MRTILFIMHTLGFGGAERSLVNLLRELPKEEYQVDLLLFQKKGELLSQIPEWVCVLEPPKELAGIYAPLQKAGRFLPVKLVGTLWARAMRKTKKEQAAFRWKHVYRRVLGQLPESYDVAAAYGGGELLYYLCDCVEADKKLVWIHNDYRAGGYSREDDLPYLSEVDKIISVSPECVKVLVQEFADFEAKMECVENITSSEVVRSLAGSEAPGEYAGQECRILSIGRLWPQKGFDMAVEAASLLKQRGVSFRWYIIGEGHLRQGLEKQIRELGLQDEVLLLGTRDNPYPYIRFCTMLVQSSRYEGKSVVLDEAKILGAPIIATDYPTVKDQVSNGEEGLVAGMTAQDIADKIIQLLTTPSLRTEIRDTLLNREYGNRSEVSRYRRLLDE